jgi:hypothetical protein
MITVGCASFPVPATRYFRVHIRGGAGDVLSCPGPFAAGVGAPTGFRFALLGPREIGQEGFRDGKVIETALKSIGAVADRPSPRSPSSSARVPPQPHQQGRCSSRGRAQALRSRGVQPPGWDPDECDELTREIGALAARDPLTSGLSKLKVAYYRLHGPAGHKSRYEDPAIERLAEIARNAKHDDATYVFTNVDMFADAKR